MHDQILQKNDFVEKVWHAALFIYVSIDYVRTVEYLIAIIQFSIGNALECDASAPVFNSQLWQLFFVATLLC